jgi:hypothetical protein
MEGNAADTMGAETEVECAGSFPRDSQLLPARSDRAGGRVRVGTLHTRLIAATLEVPADASDPRLTETGVTRTTA